MKSVIPLAALMACAATAAHGQTPPAFSNERWREDWSGVDAPWKDIALSPGLALDIGADARWKLEIIDNPRYGLTSFVDDAWLQQRLLMHFNLRAGHVARAFVELGAFDVMGRINRGANDDDRLDFQQAFLDLTPHWGETGLRVRLGRQEMEYGERFFDLGDSSNIRQHYDAVRLTLTHGPWTTDAFVAEQVANEPGVFDDDHVQGQDVYGLRAQRAVQGSTLRFFYYNQARDGLALAGVTADDRRDSYGVYANQTWGAYDGAFEIVRQDGEHGAFDVEAWGAYGELGHTFGEGSRAPRIGARITYGSGDSDSSDGVIETYAPPFPRGSWFNEAGLVSHSNVLEAAALASFTWGEVKFDTKLGGLWRADDNDFVYVSSTTALPGTNTGDAFIGVLPRVQLTWRPSRNVTVRSEWSMVAVSDDLEALGGQNVNYANLSVAFRY